MKMLELQNISFTVDDGNSKVEIIKNLSLKIPNQKFVILTGPNGSGKSTLAKIIAGIEKPSEGKIIFNGEDITEKNITERANLGVSFAFQQPVKFKGLEVIDLLRLSSRKKISIDKACEYLSEVGLCAKDYINREINSSLSGGELKRIEIATILARQTKLSIFDEPEAGIDLWSFQNLIRIFEKMQKEIRNSSILIISHQERLISIADEIIVLADGEIQYQGTSKEILPKILGTKSVSSICNKLK